MGASLLALAKYIKTDNNRKTTLANVQQKAYCDTLGEEKWQGKLTKNRLDDSALDGGGCFAWMNNWRSVPNHTVATMQELYQQMLPTKLYHQRKTGKGSGTNMWQIARKFVARAGEVWDTRSD